VLREPQGCAQVLHFGLGPRCALDSRVALGLGAG
jgi:hypothetical protein